MRSVVHGRAAQARVRPYGRAMTEAWSREENALVSAW
jgi:hypothetical protein